MPEYPGIGRGIGAERSLIRRAARFGKTGEAARKREKAKVSANMCKCPECGYEEPKIKGVRCAQVHCPKCGSIMTGE